LRQSTLSHRSPAWSARTSPVIARLKQLQAPDLGDQRPRAGLVQVG
jgi:hypothetical protein